jgi:GMP synthase-like glutamine amidotransferase
MMQELEQTPHTPIDQAEPLPFPFNQRPYCRFEPIERRIDTARVLVVDDLLRDRNDLSEVALAEWGRRTDTNLQRERKIAGMALNNIRNNISRLVRQPVTEIVHLSEVAAAADVFRPDAIVLSGTLTDFDFYSPALLAKFAGFITKTRTPVLGICGGHQLIGLSFGARIQTLDKREQHENRAQRPFEYQYRFIRITDPDDPIFAGIHDPQTGLWQDYTTEARILRVWQNHGLELDRVPEGFKLLATAYFCRNQMMVKRADGQLIYTVQFHLEKSFEDYDRTRATRWAHPNESRDGRIIFENFLQLALQHER